MSEVSNAGRRLGGREATTARIEGAYALAVGMPEKAAPPGWSWRLLTDLARLESGHTPSRRRSDYWGGDIPWIGIRDATGNHGRVLFSTNENTNELGIANSAARVLPANTVCLSRTASVGYVVVMGRPMATSQDFVNWVCADQLDYRFLKYVLIAEGETLLRFASGSVHQTIYFPEVKSFHIALPPLAEQRSIVEVLGALDDKIELNRRMNETLEAMAQAIFRDWFVDFGPVRRKLAGATDPVEIMGGVTTDPVRAAELADRQPANLDNDGLPVGWDRRPLRDVVSELRRGIGPKYSETDGILVLNQKCIRNREVSFGPARRHDDSARGVEGRTLINGDVLVNSTGVGTLGRVAQIWGVGQPVIVDSHVTVVRANTKDVSAIYLGLALGLREEEIVALGEGSTGQTELSREQLGRMEMIVPRKEIIDQFDLFCAPLVERITANRKQAETLVETRDYLLPRLMSGEIKVSSTPLALEEAR